jgi:hypothetical protein
MATVISGEQNVRMASTLAQRRALKLEIETGMKVTRRSIVDIIHRNKELAEFHSAPLPRNKRQLFVIINYYIVSSLGEQFNVTLKDQR